MSTCKKGGAENFRLCFSGLSDRTEEDYLAETEYVD